MARDVLEGDEHLPKHDLESFFWLLSWVCFRHVAHGKTMNRVKTTLDTPDAYLARGGKMAWLSDIASRRVSVKVTGNIPLEQLYSQFAGLLLEDRDDDITHDDVLGIFAHALSRQDWPKNDKSRPYKPLKTNPYYHSSIENTGSSKRKAQDDVDDQPGPSRARTGN